jgi:hypothetical protein
MCSGGKTWKSQRAQAAGPEHSSDQPINRLRSQNDHQVFVEAFGQAGLRTETGTGEQTGAVQAIPEGAAAGRCLERPGTAAGAA